jgi:NAD(P)-dependent dehydrogenase (short-subunit alcohol dehydrogenase family)
LDSPGIVAAKSRTSTPKKYRPQSPLQRLIEPEEIANMVPYLSSPLASATTGAAVRAEGGYVDSIIP